MTGCAQGLRDASVCFLQVLDLACLHFEQATVFFDRGWRRERKPVRITDQQPRAERDGGNNGNRLLVHGSGSGATSLMLKRTLHFWHSNVVPQQPRGQLTVLNLINSIFNITTLLTIQGGPVLITSFLEICSALFWCCKAYTLPSGSNNNLN